MSNLSESQANVEWTKFYTKFEEQSSTQNLRS